MAKETEKMFIEHFIESKFHQKYGLLFSAQFLESFSKHPPQFYQNNSGANTN